jgi:hypothetical protein
VIVLKRQSLPLLATPDATLKEKGTQQMRRETKPLDIGSGAHI